MKISVIIPTCNRPEMLSECLKKLTPGKQTLSFDKYEVIVTDDSNNNNTFEIIKNYFAWVKWIEGPKSGPATNRNNGVKYAKGNWVAFTDDDCIPDSGWLEAYYIAIKNYPEKMVFEGKTYADRPRSSYAEIAPINEDGGLMPSCNFLINKNLFNYINGFDNSYLFSFEDMDLTYRLKKSGQKIIFVKNASICHPWRTLNNTALWKSFKSETYGIVNFTSKHPEVLKDFNSFHFIKQAIVKVFDFKILNKNSGMYYFIVWRYFDIYMFFRLLPKTMHYLLNNRR